MLPVLAIVAACDAAYSVTPSTSSDAGASGPAFDGGDGGDGGDGDATSSDGGTAIDATATGCGVAQPGLVAFYPFDDDAGAVGRDCSGNGRNGLITNGTWSAGKHGNALHLSGNGCMDLGADAGFLQGGPFTIAMWVNLSSGALSYYVAKTSMPPQDMGWHFGLNAATQSTSVKFGTPGGPVQANAPTSQPTSTWVHVAMVFAPSKRAEVWVSGMLASGLAMPPDLITDDPGAHLRVGCGEGTNFVVGGLDDVRFYNRALSNAEIAALAQ